MSKLDEMKSHTEEVRRRARGRWDLVFSRLVPQIAPAMAKPGRHVTCPFHGGQNDFRVAKETSRRPSYLDDGRCYCTCGSWSGFDMVMHANNWDFTRAVEEVDMVLGGSSSHIPIYQELPPRKEDLEAQLKKDERIKSSIRRMWKGSVPLTDPSARPARLYLKGRQLGQVIMPLDDIGMNPALEYYDEDYKLVGRYPALVSIVRMLDGKVSTVHRTFLSVDGQKAPVSEVRKQYSSPSGNPVMGAAVRLDKTVSDVLHVAEGIESALAVRAIVDNVDPTWSTLNKELMRGLHIPDHVKVLCIWADRDKGYGGLEAATDLMKRVQATGRIAVVMLPPFEIPEGQKSVDWNDVVASLGLEATRNHFHVVKFMRSLQKCRKRLDGEVKQGKQEVVA